MNKKDSTNNNQLPDNSLKQKINQIKKPQNYHSKDYDLNKVNKGGL